MLAAIYEPIGHLPQGAGHQERRGRPSHRPPVAVGNGEGDQNRTGQPRHHGGNRSRARQTDGNPFGDPVEHHAISVNGTGDWSEP